MKKIYTYYKNILNCIFGNHEWEYMWGNYQTGKDIFHCNHCGRRKEE